jgi:hypothetical protein
MDNNPFEMLANVTLTDDLDDIDPVLRMPTPFELFIASRYMSSDNGD